MINHKNVKSYIRERNTENYINIGDFISLFDIITIYSLVKQPLSKFLIYNNNLKSENFNIGSDYILKLDFESLSMYNSFLFFGFNPRYEASLLNTCFARLTENNDSSFFQFNIGLSNFFPVIHKGGHHKNIKSFFEGRFSFLNTLRLEKTVKILYGANHFKHLKKSKNIFTFISNKFSDKPTYITHDLSIINYIEFFGGSLKQNFYKKKVNNTTTDWVLNSSFPETVSTYSNILELGLRNRCIINQEKLSKNNSNIFIPIKFFYEHNDMSLNLFGKINKTEKVSTNESSSVFSLRNWFSLFFFFSLEDNLNLYISQVYNKAHKGKKMDLTQLNLKLFKIKFLDNLNKKNLLNYFINLNIYTNNTEKFLHTFSIKTLTKFDKNYLLYNFIKLYILNFYLNYDFLSYSFTMTNSSFLYADNLFLK